jgi:tetratricopeptide (TPR) repeat protein
VQVQKRPSAFSISTSGGFARIVIVFPGEAKAEAEIAGGVLSIAVPRVIALNVQRLPQHLAGYVLSANRDGDTLRLTLARKLRVNTMAAGEKLFVDLLPETWTGLPPGLPKEVITDLARKAKQSARVAEKKPPAPKIIIAVPSPQKADPVPVVATPRHEGEVLKIAFPFGATTPAAVFRLGDALWAVFDTAQPIDISALRRDPGREVRAAELVQLASGSALRMPLDPGKPAGIEGRGNELVLVIGEAVAARALALDRIMTPEGSAAFLPLVGANRVHLLRDPESGEAIVAVTAPLLARGSPRALSYVDFRLLASVHGIALLPKADDLAIKLVADGVTIARPGGLNVADDGTVASIAEPARLFGTLAWQIDREARFRPRETELVAALTAAEPGERTAARIALARFYLANGLGAEAKGALEAAPEPDGAAKAEFFVLRALARLMLQRPREAIEDLLRPFLANSGEAALIRAAALAAAMRFAEARDAFRSGEKDLPVLPAELQRVVRMAALRAAIELETFDEAGALLKALEAREPMGAIEPRLAVLAGRLAMRLGVSEQAAALFAIAERGTDEAAAAEAVLYRIELMQARGKIARFVAIKQLEMLVRSWRGDETEAAARRLISRLHAGDARERNPVTATVREPAKTP